MKRAVYISYSVNCVSAEMDVQNIPPLGPRCPKGYLITPYSTYIYCKRYPGGEKIVPSFVAAIPASLVSMQLCVGQA